MRWLKKLCSFIVPYNVYYQPNIQFCGEQDGSIEQDLKSSLLPILTDNRSVLRAYLAIVSYDEGSTYQVALCLMISRGEDPSLVEKLVKPFWQKFKTDQELDILFLRSEQEAQLRSVCKSFYSAN